jgi:hypothetical protein
VPSIVAAAMASVFAVLVVVTAVIWLVSQARTTSDA